MGKCRLCGRTLISDSANYGSTCIEKCYSILKVNSENIKNKEEYLQNVIMLSNRKLLISKNKKTLLMDRYIALGLLKDVDLPYYDELKKNILDDIESINTFKKITNLKTAEMDLKKVYEIYKFNSKYKEIIGKEPDEIVKSKFLQNLLWNVINSGIKNYYSKKDNLAGITQALQIVVWKMGAFTLNSIGYDVSGYFLNHAIGETPCDLKIKDGFIVEKIKEDISFKNYIKETIKGYNLMKYSNFIQSEVVNFNNGDLFFAFHGTTMKIVGKKNKNIWKLNISIADIYDFTDFKELDEYIDENKTGMLGSIAYNSAMISTSSSVLTPYKIELNFEYEVKNYEK